MTVVINLLGQPSTGKSTTMADLFRTMKYRGLQVEMCPEWIKKWAWEGKKPNQYDQFYIIGKEISQQSRLFNKVDYIISDSPVFLAGFYQHYYTGENNLTQTISSFHDLAKKDGVEFYNFFLKRNKPYNPNGRFQTAIEAEEVAVKLEDWLNNLEIPFSNVTCSDEDRVDSVLKYIGIE